MSTKYKEPVLKVIEELNCCIGDATDVLYACCREYRMFPGQTAHAAGLPGHMHRSGCNELAGGGPWKSPRGAECAGEGVSIVNVENKRNARSLP